MSQLKDSLPSVPEEFRIEQNNSELPSHEPLDLELRRRAPEELLRIWLVFRKLTALRIENADDAEDLVQETFVTMIEKCRDLKLRKGLLVWGMGILRKKVGNYYRKPKRFISLDQGVIVRNRVGRVQVPASAESTVHEAELRNLVDAILEEFPSQERTVLELLFEGLSTREIAALLHPERYQNIVNRLHRGRKRLYKQLNKFGYTAPAGPQSGRRGRKPRYR